MCSKFGFPARCGVAKPDWENVGEQITLRPVRGTGPLTKEHGVWVFHTGHPLPASATDEMLRQIRAERDHNNLGGGGE
jgi:hypothetical protein